MYHTLHNSWSSHEDTVLRGLSVPSCMERRRIATIIPRRLRENEARRLLVTVNKETISLLELHMQRQSHFGGSKRADGHNLNSVMWETVLRSLRRVNYHEYQNSNVSLEITRSPWNSKTK